MSSGASARVAVGYIRLSGDEQTQHGADTQRSAIEVWAARHGVKMASWQRDDGVSGVAPIAERPGLVAAYAAVRTHSAGVLVAATAERFAQDVLVAWLIERAALTQGAIIRTADAELSAPAGGADTGWTRGAIDLARAYERVVNRTRTRAALAAKRARGERIGALPYGYRLAADGVHLEVNEAEQAVMAVVKQLASEGLSQRAIVASLAARGVVGRTGAPLQQTQVARLLRPAA